MACATTITQPDVETIVARALGHLERLIAFDTTSRNSNLALIAYVEYELAALGLHPRRLADPTGLKANLLVRAGPPAPGGVVLSGHTDVVPVDGQAWSSPPFQLRARESRFYGRGVADMKSFLALMLALAAELEQAPLRRPLWLSFTYDEEVGCLGAPSLISSLLTEKIRASSVIVGEPTEMQVVAGHKGVCVHQVKIRGREAHSSLPHHGVSANMAAAELLGHLAALARALEAGPLDPGFDPPWASLTVGVMQGGVATNILAGQCDFAFDLRTPPGVDPLAILAPFFDTASQLDRDLRAKAPEAGIKLTLRSRTPPLDPEGDTGAAALAGRLAASNAPPATVAYGAEAGHFQRAGFSTVICGPGSIRQAHQPDEYIERSQIERGGAFMARLLQDLAA